MLFAALFTLKMSEISKGKSPQKKKNLRKYVEKWIPAHLTRKLILLYVKERLINTVNEKFKNYPQNIFVILMQILSIRHRYIPQPHLTCARVVCNWN